MTLSNINSCAFGTDIDPYNSDILTLEAITRVKNVQDAKLHNCSPNNQMQLIDVISLPTESSNVTKKLQVTSKIVKILQRKVGDFFIC